MMTDYQPRTAGTGPEKAICPHCGERAGVPLIWGDPDQKTREAALRLEIVLAGCMIEPIGGDVPDYACLACAYRWSDE